MKIERFTDKARQAVHDASEVAQQHNHSQIETEHLLYALLKQEGGVAQQVIRKRMATCWRHSVLLSAR